MRLDQWLWAVRAFKSRTAAADAIKAGRVLVDGMPCKPAREFRPLEVVTVLDWERPRMLRVLGAPAKPSGAPSSCRSTPERVAPPPAALRRTRSSPGRFGGCYFTPGSALVCAGQPSTSS